MNLTDKIIEIERLANKITSRKFAFDMRRRLNPHHSKSQKDAERAVYDALQTNNFADMKRLYAENREKILQFKNLSNDQREIFRMLDSCLEDDMEKEVFGD